MSGLLHKMIGSSFKDDMNGNWLIDYTVEIQMDHYGQKVESPRRDPSGPQPLKLTDKEKKQIGHICGQLNWLPCQCGVRRRSSLRCVAHPTARSHFDCRPEDPLRSGPSSAYLFPFWSSEAHCALILGGRGLTGR